MDNKVDGKVRGEQNRRSRVTRIVEKFNLEEGCWEMVEVEETDLKHDGWKEINGQMKFAYLQIMITINEIVHSGYNPRALN